MSLTGLAAALRPDPGLSAALPLVPAAPVVDLAVPAGARPATLALLSAAQRPGAVLLAVTATGRAAEDLAADLRCYLPPHAVVELPAWETLPHERLSPRSDTVARRVAVMRRLAHPTGAGDADATGPVAVVVAPVRAVMQPVVAGLGDLVPVSLRAGEEHDLDDVVQALVDAAYTRTDMVERRGEFAVRGGILDVFPPTIDHPLRVEFFGDEVEEVRSFAVADQRSLEVVPEGVWAPPCREVLLTDAVRERALELKEQMPGAARCSTRSPRAWPWRAWSRSPRRSSTACSRSPTCSRPARWCWRSTPSASARGPTTWCRPPRSSSPPRGRTPRPATGRRSTCPRPRSTPWRRCAPTPCARACPGGRSRRSPPTPRRPRSPTRTAPASPRSPWARARCTATAATCRRRCRTCATWSAAAGAWWSRPRATARPSASPRCSARPRSPRGWSSPSPRCPSPRWSWSPPPRRRPGSSTRACGWRCSPRPTSSGAAASAAPRTCAGCRAGAATRSTPCSCAPATSSCTSSTASGSSSR